MPLDPLLRQQPDTVADSVVQQELEELGNRRGGQVQSAEAKAATVGVPRPERPIGAERVEDAFAEQVMDVLAGSLPDGACSR